jgi:hypothetical protein
VSNQEKDRILTIEDLHIYDPVVENAELVLTASFRASTFRKEEPPPPAPDEKDKKKPAAKNPVDKAKTKTDDAMKKDEDRAGSEEGADRVKGGM